ncbi:MAG: histidine kinase [Actinomycetota bacterium]
MAGVVVGLIAGLREGDWVFLILLPLLVLAFLTVGALIAARHPRNGIGWVFLTTGLLWSLSSLGSGIASYADAGRIALSDWVRTADWFGAWTFVPGIYLPVTFLFLLFPDGRLPSRRWLPVAWIVGIAILLLTIGTALRPGPMEDAIVLRTNPFGVGTVGFWEIVGGASWGLTFAGIVASVVALVVRLRRSSGREREQLKWLGYASVVVILVFVFASMGFFLFPNSPAASLVFQAIILAGLLSVPLAAGIAILRHRLYDIDVVIRKTVVFGILAVLLTAVFLVVAGAFGGMLAGTERGGSGGATIALAAAFAVGALTVPMWRLSRRIADRVVFGGRATPYEVLTGFAKRMAHGYSTDDVLPQMATVLGAATGAEQAVVWLRVGGELRPSGAWPAETVPRSPLALPGDALPAFPASERAVEVRHRGELLGALSVGMPASDPMNPSKEKLVRDLAQQGGLVLRNVRLIEELRASRQRLVAAQDHERRRLERDIHDGAQQQLVALSVKMRLLKMLSGKDPAKAGELIDQLQAATQDALDDLRDLARGIYPPLLADKGLAEALEAQARKAAIPVEVVPDGLGRYSQEAEATAYFCVLESLQNVAKYADASSVVVRIAEEEGNLVFSVSDNGRGFEVDSTPKGAGLQNMSDRAEALGGTIEVSSTPGSGTTITGRIPVSDLEERSVAKQPDADQQDPDREHGQEGEEDRDQRLHVEHPTG